MKTSNVQKHKIEKIFFIFSPPNFFKLIVSRF